MRTQDIAPSPEGKNVTMGAYVRDVFLEQVLPVLPTYCACSYVLSSARWALTFVVVATTCSVGPIMGLACMRVK